MTPAEVVARVRSAARTQTLQEKLVRQSRRLATMRHEDPLTGLFNRRYLLTRLNGLISGARRHGRALSVATVDFDRFKRLNDEHGHDAGDAVLVEITSALRDRLRAEDVIGRLGGDRLGTWDGDETPEELVKRADTALYAAKDAGRNAVRGADRASASLPRRT